ncbi:hypothetical protein CMUS01_05871 [Colletotrichum musicola]|uniref:Uncharacterized protein n=1 Tax=Colletotrichum musicola TaxID=2175873 RepID=A0A8H6KQ37_9PEZI|nr:hypothetical protein CMUS01_05871 [Colletotrichum musicola]
MMWTRMWQMESGRQTCCQLPHAPFTLGELKTVVTMAAGGLADGRTNGRRGVEGDRDPTGPEAGASSRAPRCPRPGDYPDQHCLKARLDQPPNLKAPSSPDTRRGRRFWSWGTRTAADVGALSTRSSEELLGVLFC